MFKKEEQMGRNMKEVESVIGATVKVEGNFVGQGDVIVEGVVNGSLKTDKNLKIGQGARIKADVEAQNAYIAGEVKGNVMVRERLEIAATARISGNVSAKILSVDSGARLNGKCVMNGIEGVGKKVGEGEPAP